MTKITDYTEVLWSLPFRVRIVQKLLMFFKTTPKILTKAYPYVTRENQRWENTRKARFTKA